MRIEGITWLEAIVDKLESKHHVTTAEVEDVLATQPRFRFVERGHKPGENVYAAFGRTPAAGTCSCSSSTSHAPATR